VPEEYDKSVIQRAS